MSKDSGSMLDVEERAEDVLPHEKAEEPGEAAGLLARWELVAYLVILLVALGLRLWDLGAQALHHDESLHALYGWYLYDGRGYRHDPMMHGPFQFFGYAAVYWLFWDSDAMARLLPALFGTALVGVPFLLRGHLGRSGALVTAVLLALSPTMLYFSRFARNDMYMAVWTLLLVAFIWRYMDTRKTRYLVWTAVVLGLTFATKETAYIVVLVLGSYLFLSAAPHVLPWLVGRGKLREFSRAGDLLVLMATLTLPLGAAGIAVFQDRLGLTLANPDWATAPVGMPLGTGLYVAFFAVVGLIATAFVVGLRWRPRVWLVCFGAFATVWVLLYSSFFTNFPDGLLSGIWQSLGYWVVQQDVARGGQPWYYFLVIGLNYEFLPMLVGAVAMGYYILRGNRFSRFLVYWAVAIFLFHTYASEKMPWLLVGITLPFILLAGKFLGELVDRRPWNRRWDFGEYVTGVTPFLARIHWPAVGFTAMTALLVAVAGRWLVLGLPAKSGLSTGLTVVLVLLVPSLAAACVYLLRQVETQKRKALVGLSLAGLMLALSVPSAFRVAYANADVPVELLVYTQTAPDIPQLMAEIRRLGEKTDKGRDLKITVDSTDGRSWPWAWYLRNYTSVGYPCLSNDSGCQSMSQPPDADVVLLAARSRASAASYMSAYGPPVKYKHRWWFPESYRGLDLKKAVKGIRERKSWCSVAQYFLGRQFGQTIGSIDGYAYFPKGFTPGPIGREVAKEGPSC